MTTRDMQEKFMEVMGASINFLGQMAKLYNFLGITYLVGKI